MASISIEGVYPRPGARNYPHYNSVIVAPGFSDERHLTGLARDTRERDIAASLMAKNGLTDQIVVGGAQIRDMTAPFSERMERHLRSQLRTVGPILQEQTTIDTPTQVAWVAQHRGELGKKIAIVTDSAQKRHFKALFKGFGLSSDVDVVVADRAIRDLAPNMTAALFTSINKQFHKTFYWIKWQLREAILTGITITIDPKGEKIRRLTSRRIQKQAS